MKNFSQFLYESNARIETDVVEKITTSGYDDRFLTQDIRRALTINISGCPVKATFDSKEDLFDFLVQLNGGGDEDGMDIDEMIAAIRDHTKTTFWISGNINPRCRETIPVSNDTIASINAYLHLYTGSSDSYTEAHLNECRERLQKSPIPADVLTIVKNQISECDEYVAKLNAYKQSPSEGQNE